MPAFTSPADESLLGAIGRLTVSWAYLELGLDWTVENIYNHLDGKSIEKEKPRSLSRKLTFLRAVIKRMPLPEDSAAGFYSLFDQIEEATETRHDVIHGFIVEHEDGSGEVTMARLIREKSKTRKRHFKLTAADILQAAITADKLSNRTLRMADLLQDAIDELRQQPDAQTQS